MNHFEQLKEAILSEDFYKTNEVIKLITEDDNSIEYVKSILDLMEENPDIDYGCPGPIVHYMEKFYGNGYEQLLYESVKRKPIVHTLWMLNRIINDVQGEEEEKYINLMKETANNTDLPDDVRDEAQFYLD